MRAMLAVLMAGLVLVTLSSCGNSDDTLAGTTTIEERTGTTTDTVPADEDSGGGTTMPPGVDAECSRLNNTLSELESAWGRYHYRATEEEVVELESQVDELEAKLPEPIRSDFETAATAYRAFAVALRNEGGVILAPGLQPELEEAVAGVNTPEIQAVIIRVNHYLFNVECDISDPLSGGGAKS